MPGGEIFPPGRSHVTRGGELNEILQYTCSLPDADAAPELLPSFRSANARERKQRLQYGDEVHSPLLSREWRRSSSRAVSAQ